MNQPTQAQPPHEPGHELDFQEVHADVVVVGGGAAGLAAAIFAAREAAGATVVVLDGAAKLGAKILVSGGGRCNVTNVRVTTDDFHGGSRHTIRRVIDAFSVAQTLRFFSELGVTLHEEEHGKLFPDTNEARSVLDALIGEAMRLGVRTYCSRRAAALERNADGFVVHTTSSRFLAPKVVLATGGLSLPKTGSDGAGLQLAAALGHSIVPTTPALVPLVLDGDFHRDLSGIALDVLLSVNVPGTKPIRVSGALLWTHFGVSGPVVLDASRHWHAARLAAKAVEVSVNFAAGQSFDALETAIRETAETRPTLQLRTLVSERLPNRLADAILTTVGIPSSQRMSNLSRESRRRLVHALTNWPLPVRDSRGYNHAEVTAGGVCLTEVDPRTMESRKCPGLYLVGEILDVDGRIGGFNFQWAWSSAWVAGRAIAASLQAQRGT